MVVTLYFKGNVEGIDDEPDRAPYDVGDKQSLRFVGDIRFGVTRYSLVEVACLKEKKAHEKE